MFLTYSDNDYIIDQVLCIDKIESERNISVEDNNRGESLMIK